MGTRHLIAVITNKQPKIAQYGQWDGYPGGAGIGILEFIQSVPINKFKSAVEKCTFFTEKELESLTLKEAPQCNRDIGCDILKIVMDSGGVQLTNSYDFAYDSLFCEWAYIIDLDEGQFEVYAGFNQEKLQCNERFYKEEPRHGSQKYFGVKLLYKWPLSHLPSEAEFLNTLEPQDTDD